MATVKVFVWKCVCFFFTETLSCEGKWVSTHIGKKLIKSNHCRVN